MRSPAVNDAAGMPLTPLVASSEVATWLSCNWLSAGVTVKLIVYVPASMEDAVEVRLPVAAAAFTLALALAVYQANVHLTSSKRPKGKRKEGVTPEGSALFLVLRRLQRGGCSRRGDKIQDRGCPNRNPCRPWFLGDRFQFCSKQGHYRWHSILLAQPAHRWHLRRPI